MEWNCVKDKLPNISDVVLTYWNCGKYCVMCYCGNDGKSWYSEKGKYENVYQEHGSDLFECITHWGYLPEAPSSNDGDLDFTEEESETLKEQLTEWKEQVKTQAETDKIKYKRCPDCGFDMGEIGYVWCPICGADIIVEGLD